VASSSTFSRARPFITATLLAPADASPSRQEGRVEERRKVQTTRKRGGDDGASLITFKGEIRLSSLTKEEMHRAVE
jgi:hypothetical protein